MLPSQPVKCLRGGLTLAICMPTKQSRLYAILSMKLEMKHTTTTKLPESVKLVTCGGRMEPK